MLSMAAWATPVSNTDLKQLFRRYQGLQELSVDFDQTKILKDVPTPLLSKGHLLVKTPDELVWTITSPSFLEVKLSGGNVQITTGKGPDADVQKLSRAQLASNPQSRSLESLTHWLKFDSDFLNSEYAVEKLAANKYLFRPKHESPFNDLSVELAEEGAVHSLEITEKSGDKMIIRFQKPSIKRSK